DAVLDDRRGLAERPAQTRHPRAAQLGDVRAVDLIERGVARVPGLPADDVPLPGWWALWLPWALQGKKAGAEQEDGDDPEPAHLPASGHADFLRTPAARLGDLHLARGLRVVLEERLLCGQLLLGRLHTPRDVRRARDDGVVAGCGARPHVGEELPAVLVLRRGVELGRLP